MVKDSITLDDVITFFNDWIRIDQKAVTSLFSIRVECNEITAAHPSIQVGRVSSDGNLTNNPNDKVMVGVIGVINGLFGTIPDGKLEGFGPFAVNYNDGSVVLVGKTVDMVNND